MPACDRYEQLGVFMLAAFRIGTGGNCSERSVASCSRRDKTPKGGRLSSQECEAVIVAERLLWTGCGGDVDSLEITRRRYGDLLVVELRGEGAESKPGL
jgi:hypothetical protein